jgi:recombinational DNA repair ATPase RecF
MKTEREEMSIGGIAVRGFKSICDEQHIAVRPLTILAGANSSGKSSIMQPVLLLKQTIEAPGDPGPLQLDGENVRFTSSEQLLHRRAGVSGEAGFSVRLELSRGASLETSFEVVPRRGLDV